MPRFSFRKIYSRADEESDLDPNERRYSNRNGSFACCWFRAGPSQH